MQSKAKDVASDIKEAPADRQEALTRLRRLCRRVLKGYAEGMQYGMPGYSRNSTGKVC